MRIVKKVSYPLAPIALLFTGAAPSITMPATQAPTSVSENSEQLLPPIQLQSVQPVVIKPLDLLNSSSLPIVQIPEIEHLSVCKATFIIDAGHGGQAPSGGYYPGAVSHYAGKLVRESDANLSSAQEIKNILEADGYCVVMSRTTPTIKKLDRNRTGEASEMARWRSAVADNAIALVSIHQDVRYGAGNGIRVNYGNNGFRADMVFAYALANGIGGNARAVLNARGLALTNRDNIENKKANQSTGLGATFVGAKVHMLIVIIEQTAFDSPRDIANVMNPELRYKMNWRIAKALEATAPVWHLAVEKPVPLGIPTTPTRLASLEPRP